MSDIVQDILNKLEPVFTATDEVLNEWASQKHDTNLQFPVLLGMMAVKLNWDEKQTRENDPLVRYYVRNNPDWYVTRGAHGGIMKASDKQKKEAAKSAKELAKLQLQSAIDAKTKTSQNKTDSVKESDDSDDQEFTDSDI